MKTKSISLFLLLLLFAAQGFAQKDPVERIFEKYSGQEGYTTVYISSKMFSMFSQADIEDPEFNALINNLKSIRILAQEEGGKDIDVIGMISRELPANVYEELMTVSEPGQKVKFLVKEENGKIAELLMVVGGGGDNVLIDIRGNINLKQISQLSKAIKIDGLDELEKLK